ncbi:MAG: DUF547 domain-containing protein [Planctomycetota bacterium]|nr:DUF547 domain-containing protein [Planctomycetota bacterium]
MNTGRWASNGSYGQGAFLAVLICAIAATASAYQEASVPGKTFDHAVLDGLLKSYVDEEGMVAYKEWKAKDRKTLKRYLQSASRADVEQLEGKQEKIAFWINVYNALTIDGILEFYPIESIKDKVSILFGYNIWKDFKIRVGGKERSLDEIEHKILRKMGEPRIHFALVCASIGCPRLSREAYSGKDLADQLDRQARGFLNDPERTRVVRKENTIYLSRIFKWFDEDFGGSDRAVLRFVARYRPDGEKSFFRGKKPARIRYLDYDWSLNEQKKK